jgi:hypothetical protein
MGPNHLRIRTLRAMGRGLILSSILTLIGLIIWGMITEPSFTLFLALIRYAMLISFVVSLFAMGGWMLVILPLTYVPDIDRLLGHLYLTEVIWILLAVFAFGLVIPTWAGADLWMAAWIPAIIGLSIGLSYRWLLKKETVS